MLVVGNQQHQHIDRVLEVLEQTDLSLHSSLPGTISHDHPPESTNPHRPSKDPVDTPGDDERRPDRPTEPPDMAEGTGERGGEWRATERVEAVVSRMSRGHTLGAGGSGGEEHRPQRPDEPPNEARAEA